MRKVILGAGISLDGYVARPDGSVDFLDMTRTKQAGKLMADFYGILDAVVFGRKTFDAAVKLHGGKYKSPVAIATYVFSLTLPPGERDGVMFVNQAPAAFVRQMRKRRGKHIFVMGGGELARSFLKDDAVDEIFVGVVPVLLGAGVPLFPAGFPQRDFKLVESKTYRPGWLSLKYQRARG
jgi:dihydrofolate reductase